MKISTSFLYLEVIIVEAPPKRMISSMNLEWFNLLASLTILIPRKFLIIISISGYQLINLTMIIYKIGHMGNLFLVLCFLTRKK